MSDKIIIQSDGTVANTKVKINGEELTDSNKVNSVNFQADGGQVYTYSTGEKSVSSPYVSYGVTYMDKEGKMKSIYIGSARNNVEYGSLATAKKESKDSITFIGIEDKDGNAKKALVEVLDKLRTQVPSIPTKEILEKRSVESLQDRYEDIIKDLNSK